MKKEYDFSKGKRGAVIPTVGKTRITIYLDDDIVQGFKKQSEKTGTGYQTLINEALKAHLGLKEKPLTAELVRRIVREELAANEWYVLQWPGPVVGIGRRESDDAEQAHAPERQQPASPPVSARWWAALGVMIIASIVL
jgi:hypothetical protein